MLGLFKKNPVKLVEGDARFKDYKPGVQNRLRGISKQIEGNALDLMLPVRVALGRAETLSANPKDPVLKDMTAEQVLHCKMVADLRKMRFGPELIDIAIKHKASIAAHKKPGAHGYFHPRYSMVAYNPRELPSPKDVNWHDMPYDHSETYADMMVTIYEEFTHLAQFREWGIFVPNYFMRCRPIDEQLWNIMLEVHAKIIVCMAYLQFYGQHKVERLDNSLLMQSHYKPILKKVEDIYRMYGYKAVDRDAKLLAPAMEAFFKDARAVDCYLEQSIAFMKQAKADGTISTDRYVKAFGTLPGVDGNMLEGRHENIYTLITMMPQDSRLGEFFQRHFLN